MTASKNSATLTQLNVIYGLRASGKTLAMKGILHQLKEHYAADGINVPIITNIACCWSDHELDMDNLPERSLVGLDDLTDSFQFPRNLLTALLKRKNTVFVTEQFIEQLTAIGVSHSYRLTWVDKYIKPRLYLDKDILCLDMIAIYPDPIGILPKQWVKQGTALKDISGLFCNCWKAERIRA